MSLIASGTRISWPDLPEPVRRWAEDLIGGGPVVAYESQTGGFSPGTADRLRTAGGRRAFMKAVSGDQNPRTPELHRREAAIMAQLPQTGRTPSLWGSYDDGHWVALVFEEVDGHLPQLPWVAAQIEAAVAALVELAERLTPSPISDLPSSVEAYGGMFGGWRRIRDEQPADLDPWAARHLDQLVDLAARGLTALDGDTVVHADIRADNLLVSPDGQVTVVDWPWARRGADWIDRLLLIIDVDLHGRHDPEDLVVQYLAGRADAGAVSAVLAGFTGFFTDAARQPPQPGLPTLRAFQAAQARSTLSWLERRLTD